MFNKILCYIQGLLGVRHYLRIPKAHIRSCALISKASSWHTYAIQRRPWRPHVCVPCAWISRILPHTAYVFEAGCGSGANLLWLQQQGFSKLAGNDISASAIHMCHLLAEYTHARVNAFVDDALKPLKAPRAVDALLSVNWLYHIPGSSLGQLLTVYRKCLNPKGYIVFDVVSTAYNALPDNQYHTKDLRLPVGQRRASEYTFRMTPEQVKTCAVEHGFTLVRQQKLRAWPPRMAYMIQRCD
ncbi:MAG: class I SAM-dependent methyltransferase [Desulfovibrionaceae bacterium]